MAKLSKITFAMISGRHHAPLKIAKVGRGLRGTKST